MSTSSPASPALDLEALSAILPPPPQPVGSYVPAIRVGDLLFTSGTLPVQDGKVLYQGSVGSYGVSIEQGQSAARLCALNALSIVQAEAGSLTRVKRIVKVTGFVNSPPYFTQQPAVINGASDFLVEAFGDAGKHVRAAVGVSALPLNASVELELVVELHPGV